MLNCWVECITYSLTPIYIFLDFFPTFVFTSPLSPLRRKKKLFILYQMAYWRGTANLDDGPPAYSVSNESNEEKRCVKRVKYNNLGFDYVCLKPCLKAHRAQALSS